MAWYDAKNIEQKNLGFAFGGLAANLVAENLPDLRSDFPNYRIWDCEQFAVGNVLVVRFECRERGGVPTVGLIKEDIAKEILALAREARTYGQLRAIPDLQEYFSREKLVFIVDLTDGGFDWDIAGKFVVEWLNEFAVPYALDLNQKRIVRAVPVPPQFSHGAIFNALWVLECGQSMSQGSGFFLDGVGLVTCEHVVTGTTAINAFRPSTPQKKCSVRVLKANKVLDLAILELVDETVLQTLLPSIEQSNVHDHALVCGFPNYRYGDCGIFSPGVIIGTRQQAGVRRLLTNAPIVRGMSGGPVVGKDNKVIGVCVTGADRLASADDTEDKSIVPIDALALL